jgi:hypothetical protein
MPRMYFLIVPVLFSFLLSSCSKDGSGGDNNAPESPTVVDITSPPANIIVTNGSNLRVEGTITDNNVLQSARWEIRNKATGVVLYNISNPTPNVSLYRFLWNWTVTGVTSFLYRYDKSNGQGYART